MSERHFHPLVQGLHVVGEALWGHPTIKKYPNAVQQIPCATKAALARDAVKRRHELRWDWETKKINELKRDRQPLRSPSWLLRLFSALYRAQFWHCNQPQPTHTLYHHESHAQSLLSAPRLTLHRQGRASG